MKRQTQADAVVQALRKRGGYATLKQLYEQVEYHSWGTKTPFATIRRILQKDPQSRFFKIMPGLWGLTEQREQILRELSISETAPQKKIEEFNHAYYQGLVVEIGNLLNFETFVPKPDQRKKFIDRPLAEIISIKDVYAFTYSHLVKKARTVDVIWFNDRKMPHAFWEIEHTTDFYRSLIKFLNFQDFRSNFYVVADKRRHDYFKSKINQDVYKPLQGRVQFVDYETLAELHASVQNYSRVWWLIEIKR